jgi:hypothetical protein
MRKGSAPDGDSKLGSVSGSLGDGLSAMGGSDAGDTGALRLSPVIHHRRLHLFSCTHFLYTTEPVHVCGRVAGSI